VKAVDFTSTRNQVGEEKEDRLHPIFFQTQPGNIANGVHFIVKRSSRLVRAGPDDIVNILDTVLNGRILFSL
jgi:hypothetical protein